MFRIYTLYIIAFLCFSYSSRTLIAQCPETFDEVPVTYGQTTECIFDSTYFFHLDTSEIAAELKVFYFDPITGASDSIEARNNLPPGRYLLRYRSEEGCSLIKFLYLVPFNFDKIDDQCGTGVGEAWVGNAPTDYRFLWNTGDTTNRIRNLTAGDYSITVYENANEGCFYTFPITIEEGGMPGVLAFNRSTDCNVDNGNLLPFFPAATGLEGNYTYQWNTGDTTRQISDLEAGEYIVTITNRVNNNCQAIDTFTVDFREELYLPTPLVTNPSCTGEYGSIIFPGESAEGLDVIWSTGDTSLSISNLSSGNYAATFSYGNGECNREESYYVAAVFEDIYSFVIPSSCGAASGWIDLTVVSDEIYHYEWETGDTTQYMRGLLPGDYQVTIHNSDRSCADVRTIEVLESDDFSVLLASNGQVSNENDSSGSVAILGFHDNLTFLWDTGDTTSRVENLPMGEYQVTVSVPNTTCYRVFTVEVRLDCSVLPTSYTTISHRGTCIENGAVEFRTSEPDLIFIWENGDTVTYVDDLLPGWYFYTVVDTVEACESEKSIRVISNIGTVNVDFSANCSIIGAESIIAYSTISQGTAQPATFIWSNGQTDISTTTSEISVEPDSLYQLTVITIDGCEETYTIDPSDYCDAASLDEFATIVFGSTSVGPEDTVVCIPVSIRADDSQGSNLVSFQGSFTYDTSLLELIELTSDYSPDFFYNLAASGEVRVVYYDLSLAGIPYGDTELFTACFRPLAETGIAVVEGHYLPIPWELVNTDLEIIYPDFLTGFIVLGNTQVWPGDANRNGIVNHFDLLNVGLANTKIGPQRSTTGTDWQEESVDAWPDFVPTTEINAAHADTDGNGIVEKIDQAAIDINWTLTTPWYNPLFDYDVNYPIQSEAAVPLFIQPDTAGNNAEAVFEIHLGTENYLAQQVYGLAFSITYDDLVIDDARDIVADFSDGWLGTFGNDLIATYRVFPDEERIDVGITRVDGLPINGHGKIGVLRVTIEDVIFRDEMYPFSFRLSGQKIVTPNSISLPSNAMETTCFLERTTATVEGDTEISTPAIFPNPAGDRIWFSNHVALDVSSIAIYHHGGKLVKTLPVNGQLPSSLDIAELPAGVYILTLYTPDKVHSLKLMKR